LKLLRQEYADDWAKLQIDFEPEGAASFAELDQRGILYVRPGGNGVAVMRKFLRLIADRYYSLVREIICKYDQRALILGDRYQSFFYPEVAAAAAQHVDAISTNLNAHFQDGTFVRCYLDTLHAITGKPVFVSEIYMAATENRSGNQNDHGIFPVVRTQRERAAGVRTTLDELLAIPYVVGIDWFQYHDEPTLGRFDGENFNFGLVDINDLPYEELTEVFASLEHPTPPRRGRDRSDATSGVPPAPADPLANFRPTTALAHWDRERGFIPPTSELPLADLYICWKDDAIHLGLYAYEPLEKAYYRDGQVPEEDRAQWVIKLAGASEPIVAGVGAGRDAVVDHPDVRVASLSGWDLNVRCVFVMELPARLFDKNAFHAGDVIELSSTLIGHGKVQRVEWGGKFTLRE
jgi:hypothetical protein